MAAKNDYEKGMVDLGSKPSEIKASEPSPKDKVYYPSIHLNDVYELDDLPDGEFYFTGKGKVTRHSETTDEDGTQHCSCDIEIQGIKPTGSAAPAKKGKDSGDMLSDTLDEMEFAKEEASESAQDEADEGD